MIDPFVDMIFEQEAIARWNNGEEPRFSSGVCDDLTCGYGELSQWGYWQFPLYPAEKYSKLLKKRKKDEYENNR